MWVTFAICAHSLGAHQNESPKKHKNQFFPESSYSFPSTAFSARRRTKIFHTLSQGKTLLDVLLVKHKLFCMWNFIEHYSSECRYISHNIEKQNSINKCTKCLIIIIILIFFFSTNFAENSRTNFFFVMQFVAV